MLLIARAATCSRAATSATHATALKHAGAIVQQVEVLGGNRRSLPKHFSPPRIYIHSPPLGAMVEQVLRQQAKLDLQPKQWKRSNVP